MCSPIIFTNNHKKLATDKVTNKLGNDGYMNEQIMTQTVWQRQRIYYE